VGYSNLRFNLDVAVVTYRWQPLRNVYIVLWVSNGTDIFDESSERIRTVVSTFPAATLFSPFIVGKANDNKFVVETILNEVSNIMLFDFNHHN